MLLLPPPTPRLLPPPFGPQVTSSSRDELMKLQDTQRDMASKLASAERELAQLRSASRNAGEPCARADTTLHYITLHYNNILSGLETYLRH